MLRRLRIRARSSGRIDDNPDAFQKRLDTYQKEFRRAPMAKRTRIAASKVVVATVEWDQHTSNLRQGERPHDH